jgi:transketolase
MRAQFTKTVLDLHKKNKKIFLILGDIGVYGFKNLLNKNPKRGLNLGILEQAMISFAAGLSKIGFIPVVHTIATFMVDRAFEQLKLDFGYQKLNGNFISVGGSYDYAALGCSHHCPEDINLMKNIPNMQIIIPGNSAEFHQLFIQSYRAKLPKYYRLSAEENSMTSNIVFGKANILNQGDKITIIAIGPVLNFIFDECIKLNLNLVYYTTIRPFDYKILNKIKNKTKKIIIVEPFYAGSIINEVINHYKDKALQIESISVPFDFLTNYGSKTEHDNHIGFTNENFKNIATKFLKNK